MRALEKYAVRAGGGSNHRADLASGILIKDNHVALVGSVREAVRRARANAPHTLRVVVEVDTMAQLDEAIEAGAEGILLDNFQVRDMAEAVKRVRERRPADGDRGLGGRHARPAARDQQDGRRRHLHRLADPLGPGDQLLVRDPSGHRIVGLAGVAGPRAVARSGARPMDAAALAARLHTRWLGRAFEWHAECGSTNDLAAERARAGAPAGLVIVADAQTAGRGRLGRTWHSPADENLYLSIVLRPARPTVGDPAHHAAGRRRRRAGAADVRPPAAAQVAQRRRAGG